MQARAQEITNAIGRLGEAGKPTAIWADTFGELTPANEAYLIASAADHVAMQPGGYVGLTGIAFELPFFRGLLDKIGVEPAVFRRAEYKTAMDSLIYHDLTPANQEMMNELAKGFYDQLVDGVAQARDIEPAAVEALIDRSPIAAKDALEFGLVDSLVYASEFYNEFARNWGVEDEFVGIGQYDRSFAAIISSLLIRLRS